MIGAMTPGVVEALYVSPAAEELPTAVDRAVAVPGRGLEGDRYFLGTGTFSVEGKTGQDLTLIGAEALAGLEAETGISLSGEAARRNVLTRGVDLDALIGRRFRIGTVVCRGDRTCDPCNDLQRMTQPGVLRGLARRGGLRADVVVGGEIRPGDEITALDDE
jgi:MOSC domain-containing protein YiiM